MLDVVGRAANMYRLALALMNSLNMMNLSLLCPSAYISPSLASIYLMVEIKQVKNGIYSVHIVLKT